MERLDQFITDYLDGSLTDGELRDLAELLRETPSHRSRLIGQAEVAGLLTSYHHKADDEQIVKRTMVSLPSQPGMAGVDATTQQIMAAIPTTPRVPAVPASARERTRWWLWSSVAAAVLFAAALAVKFIAFNPAQLSSVATLHSTGTVRIYSVLTGDARPARAGDEPLQSMDGVELSGTATATITYWDDTVLELSGDGAKVWMSNRQNAMAERSISRTANLGKHLVLETGVMKVKAAKQPANAPMIIITPQADAEIVGTQFVLTVKPESTTLNVSEGAVKLTRVSDSQAVTVRAHETATADNGVLKAVPQPP